MAFYPSTGTVWLYLQLLTVKSTQDLEPVVELVGIDVARQISSRSSNILYALAIEPPCPPLSPASTSSSSTSASLHSRFDKTFKFEVRDLAVIHIAVLDNVAHLVVVGES